MARNRKTLGALAALLVAVASGPALAHPCDEDAISRAEPLLRLHFNAEDSTPIGIDNTVKQLPPIKALKGDGKFDVLEVWGHIYKSDYRMRFIYAQFSEACVLMGQEILEASNPY